MFGFERGLRPRNRILGGGSEGGRRPEPSLTMSARESGLYWWANRGPSIEWWRTGSPQEQSPEEQSAQEPSPSAGASPAAAEPAAGRRATRAFGTERDSRGAFWGVMAFTFVLLIAPQTILPVLAPLRLAFLSAVGSAAALLVHRFSRRQPLVVVTREMWIAGTLAAWAALIVP